MREREEVRDDKVESNLSLVQMPLATTPYLLLSTTHFTFTVHMAITTTNFVRHVPRYNFSSSCSEYQFYSWLFFCKSFLLLYQWLIVFALNVFFFIFFITKVIKNVFIFII